MKKLYDTRNKRVKYPQNLIYIHYYISFPKFLMNNTITIIIRFDSQNCQKNNSVSFI